MDEPQFSRLVEGEFDLAEWAAIAQCFSEGLWDDYPDYRIFRTVAELVGNTDFDAIQLHAAKADAILSKPFLPKELIQKVHSLVAR